MRSISQSLKAVALVLLLALAAFSYSALTVSVDQSGRTAISGVLDGPLTIDGGRNISVDVTGGFPVVVARSSNINIKAAITMTGRPLTIIHSTDILVSDSVFDAMGADADAALVSGRDLMYTRPGEYAFSSYDPVWGAGKVFDVSLLAQGEPALRMARPDWRWFRTTSFRTGNPMYYGYNPADYSKNITFRNTKFLNAKRAGLFIHHTDGFVIDGCFADRGSVVSNEYQLGAEWSANGVFSNNTIAGNGSIATHYAAIGLVIKNNTVGGIIDVKSEGDPVLNVTIKDNTANGLRVWNGPFYGYNSAAWVENVRVSGGTYRYLWFASGQVLGGLPEVRISDIEVADVIVDWNSSAYPVAIRTEAVNGFLMRNVTIKNGGVFQDFPNRIPTVFR